MCFILGWRESTQAVAADTAWFSETQLPAWHYAMKRHNTIATFLYKLLPELPFSSYFLKVQFKCLVAVSFQWPDDRKDLQTLVIIYTNFKFQVTATVQHIFSNLDCLQYLKKKKKKVALFSLIWGKDKITVDFISVTVKGGKRATYHCSLFLEV